MPAACPCGKSMESGVGVGRRVDSMVGPGGGGQPNAIRLRLRKRRNGDDVAGRNGARRHKAR
jgi:hypothetical protein